jgi:hypothetical protein
MCKNVFFLTLLIFVLETPGNSQTLDKIINNYLIARGQTEFNELQTMIINGEHITIKGNLNSNFREYIKFPAKFRVDTFIDNMKFSIVYNNGKGGIINPFSGSNATENFPDKGIDRIQSAEKSDIQGLLYKWQDKCKLVTFEGKTTLSKNEQFKIRIITNASDTIDYYIDTKDYLLKQVVYFPGFSDPTVVTYSNYKNVKGMQLPFEILQSNHSGYISKETINEYLINPVIVDSLFELK